MEGCDVVYHLAAMLRGSPAVAFLNNVVATRKLLNVAKRFPLQRFVLVGSLGAYGTDHLSRGDALDENCGLDPQPHRRDPYTFSKVVQEQAAWEAFKQDGLPLVVVRPGVIYGPGCDFLTNRVGIRFGRWLLKMGDGRPLPYTHVDNCAEAVLLAGTVKGIEGQAFNVVDDELPTSTQLLKHARNRSDSPRVVPIPGWAIQPLSRMCELCSRWSGEQFPPVLTPYKSQAQWKRLHYSNQKAKALLGWRPMITFADGLRQTAATLTVAGSAP
jgi:nucleoside-diphosphate-sugar epimerase